MFRVQSAYHGSWALRKFNSSKRQLTSYRFRVFLGTGAHVSSAEWRRGNGKQYNWMMNDVERNKTDWCSLIRWNSIESATYLQFEGFECNLLRTHTHPHTVCIISSYAFTSDCIDLYCGCVHFVWCKWQITYFKFWLRLRINYADGEYCITVVHCLMMPYFTHLNAIDKMDNDGPV